MRSIKNITLGLATVGVMFLSGCAGDYLDTIPSPSAIKGVNQAFARFTPFFTPKNVKLGVFVFFKILQKNVNYKAIGISMDWQNEPL